MLITVSDVLKLKGFKDAVVIAGRQGLSNIVKNTTLMEVPDIFPYVDANNLLITTLYPIYNNNEAQEELIPKLAGLNLSGICIKPARYIEEIPSIMIEQANRLNFPIIELPQNANLSNLVTEILDLSLNKHIDILKFRNYVHGHLMDLFLKGADIDSLVESLSKIVKLPVILLDKESNVLCTSSDMNPEEVSIVFESNARSKDRFNVKVADLEYGEESYIKYSINAGNTKFGYIVLLKGNVNNESLIVAVEQASLLIASAFYKNYAVLEKEKTFQDGFIRDILQGKISSQIETINKAKAFGWNMEFPQIIMVLKVRIDDTKKKKDAYSYILDSMLIEKILQEKMMVNPGKSKSIYLDDSLVLFINVIFMNDVKEISKAVGKEIVERLNLKADIGVGISGVVDGIRQFPEAYEDAHNSLAVGEVLNKGSFVTHYSDYKMFNVIKEVGSKAVLDKYVQDKLGELIEFEKTTNMNLMETLRVLIEENFNAKRAAQKLFIHYNTLRYRIEKIKELGIDLENGFEIGEIALAYNIYLWIKAKES